jgi:hypothetical protein
MVADTDVVNTVRRMDRRRGLSREGLAFGPERLPIGTIPGRSHLSEIDRWQDYANGGCRIR